MNLLRWKCALALGAALLLNSIFGCSPGVPLGQVEGKVTFQGKPVTEGTISFSSDAGHGAEAKLGPEGKYAITTPEGGLPLGTYKVTVTPALYLDNSDPKTPPVMEEKKAPDIPEKYRRLGVSPFSWEVKEGKNEANFDMRR